ESCLDLRAVEAATDEGEGHAVEIRCHGAERSSRRKMPGRPRVRVRMASHGGEREHTVDHTGVFGVLHVTGSVTAAVGRQPPRYVWTISWAGRVARRHCP